MRVVVQAERAGGGAVSERDDRRARLEGEVAYHAPSRFPGLRQLSRDLALELKASEADRKALTTARRETKHWRKVLAGVRSEGEEAKRLLSEALGRMVNDSSEVGPRIERYLRIFSTIDPPPTPEPGELRLVTKDEGTT